MKGKSFRVVTAWTGGALLAAQFAAADVLTVDKAVELALRRNSQVIQADAGVLDARGGLWSAYSGVLPRVSAGVSRQNSITDKSSSSGFRYFGGVPFPTTITVDVESHGTTPTVGGSWNVLNLSSLSGLASARAGLQAAKHQRASARQDVAFGARRQFYEVVKAVKLAEVSDGALGLSRDNERRVRALFEVGSVSRSDLLKAQVQTAQSELDSLTRHHNVTVQRIGLASLLGTQETEMGAVDTVLSVVPRTYDEQAMLEDAGKNRPDLMAAEAEVRAAHAGLNSSRFLRLPYVTASGSLDFNTSSRTTTTPAGIRPVASTSKTDRQLSGQIALNWDLFDGFAANARNASARARLMRALDVRDALRRNLAGEIHQSHLSYRESLSSVDVARRALDSTTESLKLTQQKYNVGSATILELVDAQVQLQRAQSDGVSALAAIRVAEAQLNRVLGRGE